VPSTVPVAVIGVASASRAMPKSVTIAQPEAVSMRMFSALMSRCTTPRSCA
jgi:hypothetical protein